MPKEEKSKIFKDRCTDGRRVRGTEVKTYIENSRFENWKNRNNTGVGCIFSVCAALIYYVFGKGG
jgi:hypothetical protein